MENFNRDRRTLCFIKCALVDKDCRIGIDVYINGGPHRRFSPMHFMSLKMESVIKRRRYSE
jgi:hypothetical protein